MNKDTKIFVMVITGMLCFIQAGAWYMGFDGQVTVTITGLIAYLVGYVSKEGLDKKWIDKTFKNYEMSFVKKK